MAIDGTVSLVTTVRIGIETVPLKVGDARGANEVATNAVVAICVVDVPGAAVGAVGTPVK
jgi:hypothetical protein